jgi:predicted DNA-binding transcriptional regulator AlpA
MNLENIMLDILGELRWQNAQVGDLWTAEEIGRYMKLKKNSVQNTLLKKPTFPKPIIIPTAKDGGGGGKRWVAKEVKQWALKHR